MYKNVKYKLLILCSLICVYIFFQNNIYALTQEEVGKAIATFALNFQKAPDGGQRWTYDWTPANRAQAYHGIRHSDGTFHGDCVGWVSMCLHFAIGLDADCVSNGNTGFVLPSCYGFDDITYQGRATRTVIEMVPEGEPLKPGDILANWHHVMVYVGNIDGADRIVHSVGSPLSYNTFEEYSRHSNHNNGDMIDRGPAETAGVYTHAWRITEEYAKTLTQADLQTTWNGSTGDYTWGNSSYGGSGGSGNSALENFDGNTSYFPSAGDTKSDYRVANVNDKLPIYKHILLTEKYNFNSIKWKRYGHGYDGSSSPMKSDLSLGLKYPDDQNSTKLGKFVSLTLPYLQTWYIPLGMYSGILNSTSGFALSGNVYTGDTIYSGANNREIVWNFLMSKGLSEVTTAAIMGNISCEARCRF